MLHCVNFPSKAGVRLYASFLSALGLAPRDSQPLLVAVRMNGGTGLIEVIIILTQLDL